MFANALPLGAVGAKQAKLLTTKTIITDEKNNKIQDNAQSLQMAVIKRYYYAIFHSWFVSSNGFDCVKIEAETEAERLCEKEKSKTFILKAIEKFELKNIEKTIL